MTSALNAALPLDLASPFCGGGGLLPFALLLPLPLPFVGLGA